MSSQGLFSFFRIFCNFFNEGIRYLVKGSTL
nr:MAG TPA: hypothetical protein [Caudoviricetes sp.]